MELSEPNWPDTTVHILNYCIMSSCCCWLFSCSLNCLHWHNALLRENVRDGYEGFQILFKEQSLFREWQNIKKDLSCHLVQTYQHLFWNHYVEDQTVWDKSNCLFKRTSQWLCSNSELRSPVNEIISLSSTLHGPWFIYTLAIVDQVWNSGVYKWQNPKFSNIIFSCFYWLWCWKFFTI